jgi:hypothetical protein
MQDTEVREGVEMIESMWYITAVKIVDLAIKTYSLNEAQGKALKEVFLKQNNYYVKLQV